MTRLRPEDHVQLLKLAEQQFRLACTVHFAVTIGEQTLDVPVEQTFGRHRTDYREFGLRQDQADYVAPALEFVSTFVMASAIRQAFAECVENPRTHGDKNIVSAYQIARLIRNAFAHHMLRPVWSIDLDCRDRKFSVADIISLDTTGLDGAVFEWHHYGGHLAIWRLSQWVRFAVLNDRPPNSRNEPPFPSIEAYQQGRTVFIKVDPPANDEEAVSGEG